MRWGTVTAGLALIGCGGAMTGGASGGDSAVVTIDPPAFLQEVGAESSVVLRRPERSAEELDAARREARGAERRAAMRDYAVALMFEADGEEGRAARRTRQRLDRIVDAARRGSRDATINAELDFVKLWSAWRAGSRRAGAMAERYATRHRRVGGTLVALAWMIGGEAAFVEDDFDAAIASYRFALGSPGSPLYAFALLRTAHAHRRAGHADDARQALSEVETMGCDATSPLVARVALAAATEARTGTREDPDGVTRPASCPEPPAEGEEEEEGWRPAE